MKILNLYAGIGGNRAAWDYPEMRVTAVELNEKIAAVYRDRFPGDQLIVGDAHQYLLDHFREYDVIWASSPCQSHSRSRKWAGHAPVYPDMRLYQEIIFLKHYFSGAWVAENVVPYYQPLIAPTAIIGRHCFWSGSRLSPVGASEVLSLITEGSRAEWSAIHGIDLSLYELAGLRTDQIYRNCVERSLGRFVMDQVLSVRRAPISSQLALAV